MSNWVRNRSTCSKAIPTPNDPDDETYPQLALNYLKLDRVPLYNESWSPIVEGIRSGNFFGTTGELLFHNSSIEGTGAKSTYNATIEYTFPLDFAELVWSDGIYVGRQIINLTETNPSARRLSRFPLMSPAKNACGLPYETQQVTEPGSSQSH